MIQHAQALPLNYAALFSSQAAGESPITKKEQVTRHQYQIPFAGNGRIYPTRIIYTCVSACQVGKSGKKKEKKKLKTCANGADKLQ